MANFYKMPQLSFETHTGTEVWKVVGKNPTLCEKTEAPED